VTKRQQTITFVYDTDAEHDNPQADWFAPGTKLLHGQIKPAWDYERNSDLHFDVISALPSTPYIEDDFLEKNPEFHFRTGVGTKVERRYRAVVHNGSVYVTSDVDDNIGIWQPDHVLRNLKTNAWKLA